MVKKNLFNKMSFFLIYLYIPSIIFSNALSNILLLIFSFFSFYLILKNRIQIPTWIVYFIIFIFFYFFHPSNFKEFDLEKLIKIFFLIRFPLFVLLILYLADKEDNRKYFKIIFKIIFLFLVLLSIDIIYQFIFKIDLLGYKPGAWDENILDYKRYSGFFNDEYIGGAYLYLNSYLVLYLFLKVKLLLKYGFLLAAISLILIATIMSGERVALFKLSLMIMISAFFLLPVFKGKKIYLIIMFSLATMFVLNNDTLSRRYIDSTISEIGNFENIKNNSYHYLHYKTALDTKYDKMSRIQKTYEGASPKIKADLKNKFKDSFKSGDTISAIRRETRRTEAAKGGRMGYKVGKSVKKKGGCAIKGKSPILR